MVLFPDTKRIVFPRSEMASCLEQNVTGAWIGIKGPVRESDLCDVKRKTIVVISLGSKSVGPIGPSVPFLGLTQSFRAGEKTLRHPKQGRGLHVVTTLNAKREIKRKNQGSQTLGKLDCGTDCAAQWRCRLKSGFAAAKRATLASVQRYAE